MSIVQQVRDLEAQKNQMEKKLEELKAIAQPHEELLAKIRADATAKNLSLRELALDMCPELATSGKVAAVKQTRKARAEKTYKNPHTGELVVTKGGNNKVLKEWKAEHGSDEVETWSTITG